MRGKEWLKTLFLSLLLSSFLFAAVPQTNQLTELSSTIRQELLNLKEQTVTLQTDLNDTINLLQIRSQDLRLSETERKQLEAQRTELYTSLTNMTKSYSSLYVKYLQQNNDLERKGEVIKWCLIVLITFVVLKIIRIIVGLKWPWTNQFIPWWVDVVI